MRNIFDKAFLQELASQYGLQAEAGPAYARAQSMGAEWLIGQIESARLDGKGGARYPTHQKARMLHAKQAPIKHLIINGAEHEPGSLKDGWLQTRHPHAVVEGALCMALAVGATHVHFAINEISSEAAIAMRQSVDGFSETHGSLPQLLVHVIPDVYVAGEETALIQALQGREPKPAGRPPFPVDSGLDAAPTLVHNVETVSHIPYIVLRGADAYRELGRMGMGPTLCTFGEEFANHGVKLVPQGIPIAELIDAYGGGLRNQQPIIALQPGGPSSAYLAAADFNCTFDAAALAAQGSALGCAAIRGFSNTDDLLGAVREIADFFAAASCGQCPPCTMQTRMMSTIVKQIAAGKGGKPLIDQITRIAEINQDKGLCSLIRMPVPPIQSLLRHFPDIKRHNTETT